MSAVCFWPRFLFVSRGIGFPSSTSGELLDLKNLEALIPEWEELAANAVEPNPFHEHWILRPALECFAGNDVAVLAVRSEGRLCALLPVQRVSRYKKLPLRALVSWRHKHSMLCTPLMRAGGLAPLLDVASRFACLLEVHFVPREKSFDQLLKKRTTARTG